MGEITMWNRALSAEELRQVQRFGPLAVPEGLILPEVEMFTMTGWIRREAEAGQGDTVYRIPPEVLARVPVDGQWHLVTWASGQAGETDPRPAEPPEAATCSHGRGLTVACRACVREFGGARR